jgi:hypothetical protein
MRRAVFAASPPEHREERTSRPQLDSVVPASRGDHVPGRLGGHRLHGALVATAHQHPGVLPVRLPDTNCLVHGGSSQTLTCAHACAKEQHERGCCEQAEGRRARGGGKGCEDELATVERALPTGRGCC